MGFGARRGAGEAGLNAAKKLVAAGGVRMKVGGTTNGEPDESRAKVPLHVL